MLAEHVGFNFNRGVIKESVRGKDLFIMVDVCNHNLTYSICGQENHMSPDDHYQDLKRVIGAVAGKAKRINVIMPFLYGGRQHKRSSRESLDCAMMLQELVAMGVSNILTFDAHDARVQNAVPLTGFDDVRPAYQMIKGMCPDTMLVDNNLVLQNMPHLKVDEAFTEVNRSIARYIETCIATIRNDIRVEMEKVHVEIECKYNDVGEYPLANIISA